MIRRRDDPSLPGRNLFPAAAATFVTCVTIIAIHRESFRTLVSAHGLLHSAIAQHFSWAWLPIQRPENPFFAGEQLPYYWFYHYVSARIAVLAGVHPLRVFEALGLLAVALVWLAGAGLGRQLGWKTGGSLAIGFLAFAGANALGFVLLLAKLASGRSWPADDGRYLWGLTHPAMGMLRFNDPGALYGPLINFFLNNSSRALGLALSLVTLLMLVRYRQTGRVSTLGALVLAAAASTALSPIVGLIAAVAFAGLLGSEWILTGSAGAGSRFVPAALALLAGCAAAVPTYYHLFKRSGRSEIVFGFRPDLLATIIVSAGPLLLLALLALTRPAPHRRFLGLLTAAGLALLLGTAMLRIPGSNESDLFHVAVFMLAVPAAGTLSAIGRWPPLKRRIAAGLVLATFSSTPLVVLWTYWNRPAVPLTIDGDRLRRVPVDSARAKAYDWIRSTTPVNSVLVVDDRLLTSTILGNVPEIPALTDRALFVASQPDYLVNLYPDAIDRRRIAESLVIGQALAPADRAELTALARPIFLIVQRRVDLNLSSLETLYGPAAFQDQEIAIFPLIV